MTVAGVSRLGKWERRGTAGGGMMRENSAARELIAVCFLSDNANKRLVPFDSNSTRA